tara:strand:- start:638 stop:811 length:174 start_codon:yes stop_codon:yes gene_type:complete
MTSSTIEKPKRKTKQISLTFAECEEPLIDVLDQGLETLHMDRSAYFKTKIREDFLKG